MSSDYSFTDEQKAWMMEVARDSATAAAEGRDYTPPEPDASWKLLHDKGAATQFQTALEVMVNEDRKTVRQLDVGDVGGTTTIELM